MTDVSNRKRQPKGIPVGGEFAANEHDEAMSSLDAAIARDNIVAIDAEHFDAVQSAVGEKGSLVTRLDAEELLSAESGTRPRMYGLIQREDSDQYEIVSLKSQYDLDRHDTVAQWVSGTTVADLISPANPATETASDHLIADAERRWVGDRAEYLDMRDSPTDDDYQASFDTIASDISNDSFPNGENSWNTVMGSSARRTQANIEKYSQHLGRVAGNDPKYRERHTSYAKTRASLNSYARAYETGVAVHPAAAAYFEEVWNDPEHSHGEAKLREQKNQNEIDRGALESGRLKPSAVVGGGYRNPKKAASEYLERRRLEIERALTTRGRSQSTLASNALSREKRAIAGE